MLILCSIWFSPTFSYIASIALWKKGDKQVAVLGDVHEEGKTDVCHRSLLIPFFYQLSKQYKKTEVILEHQPEDVFESDQEYLCLLEMSRFAYHHNLQLGRLSFVLADIRKEFTYLSQGSRLYNFFLGNDFIKKANYEIIIDDEMTNDKLFDEFDKAIKILNVFKSKLKDKQTKNYFDELYQHLLGRKNKLKTFTIERYLVLRRYHDFW